MITEKFDRTRQGYRGHLTEWPNLQEVADSYTDMRTWLNDTIMPWLS